MTTKRAALAITAAAAALVGSAPAQDGALDSDPYFAGLPQDPYAAPRRATGGQTEAAPAARALPRPRSGIEPAYGSAAPRPNVPTELRGAPANGAPRAADRPLTAYVEARTGWDGPRGARADDGILLGATAGFDRAFARFAGGRFYAGLFGSIDLSSAERTAAEVARDETGANPVLTLTEAPVEAVRDVEVGARLGWRNGRMGLYAMTAFTNRKLETETVTTTFTELPDPDDADAVVFTQDSLERSGAQGLFADGWRVGAGAEIRVVGPAYMHLGYRYARYGTNDEKHQVLTGLGARF